MTLDAEYFEYFISGDVLTFCPTLILFGVRGSSWLGKWSPGLGVEYPVFEGEALALRFCGVGGVGGMTRSRTTGPRLL